ncbi:MAG: N-acetylmuramoyl-L-alanine amidase [Bacteroidales bacterium]|nr:N-acetylmuramoyl-L-alanine amidase [Bacteroidales bacterium]
MSFSKANILVILFLFMNALCLPAQDYPSVKAEKGEGIYALLRRHNLDPDEHYKTFLEINKNRLNPNLQLIQGKSYLLPVTLESMPKEDKNLTGVYPIFGKKYETVEFLSEQLRGAVFYIVAGHGGPDPGAVGKKNNHTLCEDEYAYDIALRLARNLIEYNATVYVITRDPNDGIRDDAYLKCDKDERSWGDHTIPLNTTLRLKQKVDAVNELYEKHRGQYQRKIELHVDSRYSNQKVDIFFYYHPGSSQGKKLGETLLKTIKAKYDEHQPNRGYKGTLSDRNLYTLRNTKPVSSYIELGNINHPKDLERLIIVSNRQAIANWLTLGLIKDFENSRK